MANNSSTCLTSVLQSEFDAITSAFPGIPLSDHALQRELIGGDGSPDRLAAIQRYLVVIHQMPARLLAPELKGHDVVPLEVQRHRAYEQIAQRQLFFSNGRAG